MKSSGKVPVRVSVLEAELDTPTEAVHLGRARGDASADRVADLDRPNPDRSS